MDFLKKYNIRIKNKNLLDEALTHSSYSNEHKNTTNYERLEFLGDSILSAVVSEYFYKNTSLSEGDMSKKRASFVCEQALAYYGIEINLPDYIKLGEGQKNKVNESIIADVFEAIIAVIFLEQGFYAAKKFIYKTVIPSIKEDKLFFSDYKSSLQELIQSNNGVVEYVVIKETGSGNNKQFTVEARVGNNIYGTGIGKSKKEAEQEAAKMAFNKKV